MASGANIKGEDGVVMVDINDPETFRLHFEAAEASPRTIILPSSGGR
jgi:hypothetical protein